MKGRGKLDKREGVKVEEKEEGRRGRLNIWERKKARNRRRVDDEKKER